MKDFPVTFSLTEEQEATLEALTALINERAQATRTPAEIFQTIMTAGSASVIDERFHATAKLIGREP